MRKSGAAPARLTITFGFGPSLFGRPGSGDRFGLAVLRPAELNDLPPLPGDRLEPGRGGGDLAVQACADDPQVAFHAVRSLARIGRGTVVPRWSQLGFGRTSSTSRGQDTPRNLLGFKDGTNNLKGEDADLLVVAGRLTSHGLTSSRPGPERPPTTSARLPPLTSPTSTLPPGVTARVDVTRTVRFTGGVTSLAGAGGGRVLWALSGDSVVRIEPARAAGLR